MMIQNAMLKRSHESIANSFIVVDFVGCLFGTHTLAGQAEFCFAVAQVTSAEDPRLGTSETSASQLA